MRDTNLTCFSYLLGFVSITIVSSGLSAQAKTVPSNKVASATEPLPGTVSTSAAALKNQTSGTSPQLVAQTDGNTPNLITPGNSPGPTAPSNGVAPGRKTRGGSSYVGVAGNIGISGGESALGVGNVTVFSKIGLTRYLSVRPGIVAGDNPVILLPVTVDLPLQRESVATKAFRIAPYIGGGLAINAGDNSDAGGLVTGGVDVPLSPQFTATAAVNAAFINDTSVGVLIGVAYNFNGF